MQYIETQLNTLYRRGIISFEELDKLETDGHKQINLLDNNIATVTFTSDLFTIKTAYEYIINNCPARLNKQILQSCDINNFLQENVIYDKTTSEKVKEDLISSIPLSTGMVQAGERIVDRGEIVDHHTFYVLRSLKFIHEN